MPRLRPDRRALRRSEAAQRQSRYNQFVNDTLLGSSTDVAQKYFLGLSPTQQERVWNDPAFNHLTWLVRLREEVPRG